MTITDRVTQIQNDSGTSAWLREALRTAMLQQDPVAVLRDCTVLFNLLAERVREIEEARQRRKL